MVVRPSLQDRRTRCVVPGFDGALLSPSWRDLPRNCPGWTARYRAHRFDQICRANDIEHRLTKPFTVDAVNLEDVLRYIQTNLALLTCMRTAPFPLVDQSQRRLGTLRCCWLGAVH